MKGFAISVAAIIMVLPLLIPAYLYLDAVYIPWLP
jgi:hypothetical protein